MSAIIVSAVSTQIAIQAAARARQQHIEACTAILSNGSSPQNSVQEIQSYSECVQFMYPVQDSSHIAEGKIIVAALLLGALLGAIIGFVKSDYDKPVYISLGALIGLCAVMIADMVVMGICFIFS